MPSVFRRRFLSYQDILDPNEMAQDIRPFEELLSGNIDADNLDATSLSAEAVMASTSNCTPYYSEVICHPRFENTADSGVHHNLGVRHPNFLNPSSTQTLIPVSSDDSYGLKGDSAGFRSTNLQPLSSGSGWIALAGGEDMIKRGEIDGTDYVSGRDVDFTIQTQAATGESKLWINAFVQYVRNGFGWSSQEDYTHMDDRDYDATAYESAPAVRPHNIFFTPGPKEESYYPSRCGMHHLSQGFTSANVQFAIRLNGQVLEETITGKRFEQERSSLGARHIQTRERNTDADTSSSGYGTKPTIYKLPGPAQKQTRATGIGPEMLGVRLGTVVSVGPGPHTIEVVARRLTMVTKNTNLPFDVVGIHNRQLSVLELPISRSIDTSYSSKALIPSAIESEDIVSYGSIGDPLDKLSNVKEVGFNNITSEMIRPGSLRNEHLRSRVLCSKVKYSDGVNETNSTFPTDDFHFYWDSLSTLNSNVITTTDTSAGNGWSFVGGDGDPHVKVTNSNSDNHRIDIDDESVLVVLADIQHVAIEANGDVPLRTHLLDLFAGYAIGHREMATGAPPGAPGDGSAVTGDSSGTWRIDQASRVYVNSWNANGRDLDYQIKHSVGGDPAGTRRQNDKRVGEGSNEWHYVNVSLMFVLSDKLRRRDPDGNFWKIGDIGLFYAGSASFFNFAGGPDWWDHYWDLGKDFLITHTNPPTASTYRDPESFTMNPPTIKHGKASISLLHLKK
jgi:hypothetical protein